MGETPKPSFDRPVTGPGTEFDSPAFRAKQGDTTVAATPSPCLPEPTSRAETIETSSGEAAPVVSLPMAAAMAGHLAKAARPKTKANWEWQRKKNRRKMAKQARRKNR